MSDLFTERAIITIYSVASGKSLAVHPQLHGGLPFGEGGDGDFARWEVDVDDKKGDSKHKVVRLARKLAIDHNERATSYLRIYADAHKHLVIDGVGGGGDFCYFRVYDDDQKNHVMLESVAFPKHWFGITPEGKCTIIERPEPGPAGHFMVTLADDNPFDNKSAGAVVRLTVPSTGKNLRIVDGKDNKNGNANVNGLGGAGVFAKFIVKPLDGDTVRLESFKYQDGKHYLRIFDNAVDGSGGAGPNTIFRVHKVRPGFYSFESKAFPGQRVGVDARGHATVDTNASHDFFVTRVR